MACSRAVVPVWSSNTPVPVKLMKSFGTAIEQAIGPFYSSLIIFYSPVIRPND